LLVPEHPSNLQDIVTVPPPDGAGSVLPAPGVLFPAVPFDVRLLHRCVWPAPAQGSAEPVARLLLAIVSITNCPEATLVTLTVGVVVFPVAEKYVPNASAGV
jgi:hypothetical protein